MNPLAMAELEYNRSQILNVTPTVDSSLPAQAETTEPENKEISVNTPATIEQREPVFTTPAVPVAEVGIKFMLVTGSFKSEENALSMIRNLQARGFSPEVSEGPNGFFRVSAGSYNSAEEADSMLKKVKKAFPGSWICKSN